MAQKPDSDKNYNRMAGRLSETQWFSVPRSLRSDIERTLNEIFLKSASDPKDPVHFAQADGDDDLDRDEDDEDWDDDDDLDDDDESDEDDDDQGVHDPFDDDDDDDEETW